MNRIGWSVINSTNLTKRINTKLKPTPKEVGFSIRELCGIKCFGFTTLSPIQDGGPLNSAALSLFLIKINSFAYNIASTFKAYLY